LASCFTILWINIVWGIILVFVLYVNIAVVASARLGSLNMNMENRLAINLDLVLKYSWLGLQLMTWDSGFTPKYDYIIMYRNILCRRCCLEVRATGTFLRKD
jgi:hypothetical protein